MSLKCILQGQDSKNLVTKVELNDHIADKSNPHEVTAEQVGAMHDYGLIHPENLQTWASAQELSGTFMVDPSTLLGVPYASAWLGSVTIIKKDINNGYGLYIFNYHDSYCCMSNAGKWTEPWVKLTPNKYPSNPNLLDNWYFINPVNQRGQTEYTTNYAIDRWWLQDSTNLNVVEGGVNVIGKWDIEQFFEKALPNGTYTLSLLYKDKIGSDPLRLIAANRSSGDVAQKITKDASGLLSITFTSGKCDKIVVGFAGSMDNVATFVAIKLELGDTQTLAHKEGDKWVLNEIPDYGEQLSRCQRYCVSFKQYDTFFPTDTTDFIVELPGAMRTSPSITNAENITNANNVTMAWYNVGSNQLRLRSSTTHNGAKAVCSGLVLFSADL